MENITFVHLLLQRQDVRSRDGVSVDEGQKLLEDGEEGPVGEDADALLPVDAAAANGPPVHHAEQAQPDALPLRQQLPGERLVELEGGAINLQRERGGVLKLLCSPQEETHAG